MGQRANLIVVENGAYELYYSHWCANTLPRDLFWGPDHALSFVRIQRRVDESGWLDEVWAEGGAVVDLDRRLLLLYGGEDLNYEVPIRRLYLALLRAVWEPWTVRWAHEGIAEIAEYVGYPRSRVLVEPKEVDTLSSIAPPKDPKWTEIVMSFVGDDGATKLFPLAEGVKSYLLRGSVLADLARRTKGMAELDVAATGAEFPRGGFHVNARERTVDFWCAAEWADAPARVAAVWPGWEARWQRDRFEAQLDLCGARLRFPYLSRETLEARIGEMLLHEPSASPVDGLLMFADLERREGKEVEINEYALRDDRLGLSGSERARILDRALEAVRGLSGDRSFG
jgi:hypothetical protein